MMAPANSKPARIYQLGSLALMTALLMSGVLSSAGCGSNTPTRVNVQLVGSAPDTTSVQVLFAVDGISDKRSPYNFDKNTTYFGIDFPDLDTAGVVTVGAQTFAKGCITAEGQSQVTIQSGHTYEIQVMLSAKTKACPVTVLTKGNGIVKSDPIGVDCGQTCINFFEYGKIAKFSALPGIPTSPYVWGGKCGGGAGCEFVVDGPATVSANFAPRVCTPAGFCWEYPTPQGASLNGVWIAPDQTTYAVGAAGSILRNDGTQWSSLNSGTRKLLNAVWGTSNSDVWTVGDGVVLHWNGAAWISSTIPVIDYYNSVWGSSATDVWTVGNNGTILHYDGVNWKKDPYTTSVRLAAVWGSSMNDVWIVGSDGTALHNTGTGWTPTDAMTRETFRGLSGTGPGDVWAVGNVVRRWNGTQWVVAEKGLSSPIYISAVWASGANTVWGTSGQGNILRWNGSQWAVAATLSPNSTYTSVYGISGLAWAVGTDGTISQLIAGEWQLKSSPSFQGFSNVWLNGTDDGWAIGRNGVMFRWDSINWNPTMPMTTVDLYGIWGSGKDDVWVCGTGGTILRFNGTDWTPIALPSGISIPPSGSLNDIYGSGPNDVWIVGSALPSIFVLHWDGAKLSSVSPPPAASSVYANTDAVYVAAGSNGLYQLSGTAWTKVKDVSAFKVRGQGSELYVAGGDGLHRWDGATWTQQYAGESYNALYVRSPGDVWAFGGAGLDTKLVHWNGSLWSEFERFPVNILGIHGTGTKDVWVVGASNSVLHLAQ